MPVPARTLAAVAWGLLLLLLPAFAGTAEGPSLADIAATAEGAPLVPDPQVVRASGPTLRWRADPTGALRLSPPAKGAPAGLELVLGYGERWPATVAVEVRGAGDEQVATFTLHPDGLGWRRLVVDLRADAESPVGPAAPRRMVLRTPGWSGDVWIASAAWLAKPPYRRTPDPYCPTIYHGNEGPYYGDPKGEYAEATLEWLRADQSVPPPAPEPTAAAVQEAEQVYRRYLALILGPEGAPGPFAVAAGKAQDAWIVAALGNLDRLGLHRQGPWVVDARGVQPAIATVRPLLTPAAMAYRRHPDPGLLDRLLLAFDALHQDGFARCNPASGDDSSMLFVRLELASYAHAVGLLRDELAARGRLAAIHDNLRWQSKAGEMDGAWRFDVNADSLRGEALPRLICALCAPDPARRVQELAGFRTWLTDGLRVRASLHGFIKPDRSVNHHNNAYLVEYGPHGIQAAAMAAWVLAGSGWALDAGTRERLEGCADLLVELSRGFCLPMGVRGRFPDETQVMVRNLATFLSLADPAVFSGRHGATARRLIAAMGTPAALRELSGLAVKLRLGWRGVGQITAAADRITAGPGTTPTAAPAPGLTIANWAGVANVRADGWSAAIQGCSRWHFDFESGLYPYVQNDWGRFIRYGTIELWSGADPFQEDTAGLALNHGWDWSRMPGATTLALAAEELGLPAPPKPRRMRNFSATGTCAGVAGPAGLGLFSVHLQDNAFPGSLTARKTVVIAGDQLICLGNGIASTLPETPVVTTLFQFGRAPQPGDETVGPATESATEAARDATFRDPAGNAFTLLTPARVVSRSGLQRGPTSTGRWTTGIFATAWIDHGAAPGDGAYAYLIAPKVVGREPRRPAFEILQADASAQVVRFPVLGATAYAGFTRAAVALGPLRSWDRPCLVWSDQSRPGILDLAVVDPDLGCPDGHQMEDRRESAPTRVILELDGRYAADPQPECLTATIGERTRCTVTCRAGAPVPVHLHRLPDGDR
jgi:Lyase, catalytic/Polysaccharide lyase family 8, super-sandwich domain